MRDGIKQADGIKVGVACGHPNQTPGTVCVYCNQVVPEPQQETDLQEQ